MEKVENDSKKALPENRNQKNIKIGIQVAQ
jgi:hypothetical protein